MNSLKLRLSESDADVEILAMNEESVLQVHRPLALIQLNLCAKASARCVKQCLQMAYLEFPQKARYHLVCLHQTDILPNARP